MVEKGPVAKNLTSEPSIAFPRGRVIHTALQSLIPVMGAQCSAGKLKGFLIFPDYTQAQ